MNSRKQKSILDALTSDIIDYLFPGLEYDIPMECSEPDLPVPCSAAMMDMAEPSLPSPRMLSIPKLSVRAEPNPDDLDPRTKEMLKEIEKILRKYGVSIEELDGVIGYTVKLSHLRITRAGRMFLTDFDDREVKMDNVSKALYFLYLRHPEGIKIKDVIDHRDELLEIYGSVCGRDDPSAIEKSIDHLVNPLGNALNVAASRIKIAFCNVVSERVARFYYINGSAREVKSVPLDRDLVLWEY